jgi:anaerobic ribonucleoside-triphosphate reductase activating protein
VVALGWGERVGIWTLGCSIHCAGCMARDTWTADPAGDVPVAELLRVVEECRPVDGVTVSGGEPLDQADELVTLLAGLRRIVDADGGDILCFSGRSAGVVRSRHGDVLDLVDAMVVGPYDERRPSQSPLMGSENQELIITTELGALRYGGWTQPRRMQVDVSARRLYTIGVPGVGDLAAVEAAAAASGLEVHAPSWRDGAVRP